MNDLSLQNRFPGCDEQLIICTESCIDCGGRLPAGELSVSSAGSARAALAPALPTVIVVTRRHVLGFGGALPSAIPHEQSHAISRV